MKISDVTKNLNKDTNRQVVIKFERLMATSYRFKNLDSDNKKLILDLIKKYKERIRKGISITRLMIKSDRSYLYRNRIKLGLSSTDLKQIYNLLESFKS